MGHSYTNLLVHTIFSTKDRLPLLPLEIQPQLHEYMGGIARGEFGVALQIGGTDNHIHGFFSLRSDIAVSMAMSKLKSLSSGWIKKTFPGMGDFAWQIGYGAFSVSQSNRNRVLRYIENQIEHHRMRSFEEEFVAFLKRHGVQYDSQTIWT